jgi:hypothetical protein
MAIVKLRVPATRSTVSFMADMENPFVNPSSLLTLASATIGSLATSSDSGLGDELDDFDFENHDEKNEDLVDEGEGEGELEDEDEEGSGGGGGADSKVGREEFQIETYSASTASGILYGIKNKENGYMTSQSPLYRSMRMGSGVALEEEEIAGSANSSAILFTNC